jgi:hypothetical protein
MASDAFKQHPEIAQRNNNMTRLTSTVMVLGMLLILSGCSAHHSSVGEDPSKALLFEADEKRVFDIVYSSIQEVFPTEKISVITTPTRGYIAKFLAPPLFLDWFTQKILVHSAVGFNNKGQEVSGYWIEVSGSGSSFLQGQLKNKEVFDTIIAHLGENTKKHLVSSRTKKAYSVPQENFYVRGSDTLEGEGMRIVIKNGVGGSPHKNREQQLRDLHQLKVDGILTQKEYEAAKQKVLEKY